MLFHCEESVRSWPSGFAWQSKKHFPKAVSWVRSHHCFGETLNQAVGSIVVSYSD